jgi:WD40 repeat protein
VFAASKGKVTKWDLKSETARVLLNMNPSSDYSYAFSPDAKLLAYTTDEQQQVIVWDIEAEKPMVALDRGPGKAGIRLSFSADGQTLAASGDHKLTVWDLHTGNGTPLNQLDDVEVKSFAFSPDGETIAIGGFKSEILQWDFRKRRQR